MSPGHGPRAAEWHAAIAALLAGAGGLLLGLQVDADGSVSGTGLAALAIGALIALVATLARSGTGGTIPRDATGSLAAVTAFLGLSFVVAGSLAPGGPWMFFEVFLLLVLLTVVRRGPRQGARWIGGGTLVALGLMLLFRLWISYQGSEHRWELLSVGIPVLSWIPFDFLEPIQTVSLGSFTPAELGFPPAGLSFGPSTALWSIGFCLAAAGIAIAQSAQQENENDRIHDLIHTLPPPLARLVEKLLPEEDWRSLGLHGLPERRLAKRIEALASEGFRRQREIETMFRATSREALPEALSDSGTFAEGIRRAISRPAGVAEREERSA